MARKSLLAPALAALAGLAAGAACVTGLVLAGGTAGDRLQGLTADLTRRVLEADTACRQFVATNREPLLAEYRSAIADVSALSGQLARLSSSTEFRGSGDGLAPALRALAASIGEWRSAYAEKAIQYRLDGESSRLGGLTRKGAGAEASAMVRRALDRVRKAAEDAVQSGRARSASTARLWTGGAAAGLALFLAAGWVTVARGASRLSAMHERSAFLEALSEYTERLHHRGAGEDEAARMLAVLVRNRFDSPHACVLFRTPEGGLREAASEGKPSGDGTHSAILDDLSACPVFRTGHGLSVPHVSRGHACTCPLGVPDSGGYACVPLMVQDRVTGLLNWKTHGRRSRLRTEMEEADKLLRVTSLALSSRTALDTATRDATTDALTGVFNRRFMDGFLDKQMRGAARLRRPLSFLLMDLDKFKSFNDTHGHPAGDVLLRAFARTAAACVRDGDLVARYGGEEFGVVLPDADLEAASEIAERIRASAEALKVAELSGLKPPIATVSIGLAVAPANGRTPAELIGSADEALYRSKQGGRNRVTAADTPEG